MMPLMTSKTAPSAPKTGRKSRASAQGYKKGEETRRRILSAASQIFGEHGYASATTRMIAQNAETNLPSLTYYFGNKEGLYRACAEEIVADYHTSVGALAEEIAAMLATNMDAATAQTLLFELLSNLARFLLTSPDTESRALFVQHEMASPGAAFEILYSQLWSPGIGLTALLIRAASRNQIGERAAWVRAVMMIGSLTSLIAGRPIITRTAGDDDLETLVLDALHDQIHSLAR
jgi:AcrR family transcriptional regulator